MRASLLSCLLILSSYLVATFEPIWENYSSVNTFDIEGMIITVAARAWPCSTVQDREEFSRWIAKCTAFHYRDYEEHKRPRLFCINTARLLKQCRANQMRLQFKLNQSVHVHTFIKSAQDEYRYLAPTGNERSIVWEKPVYKKVN